MYEKQAKNLNNKKTKKNHYKTMYQWMTKIEKDKRKYYTNDKTQQND